MPLLVRMPERPCSTTRIREVVSPRSPGLGLSSLYLGFVNLEHGERRGFDFGPLDTVAVVMSGSVDVEWEDADGRARHEIAEGRSNVFHGLPWAICANPFTTLHVKGLSAGVELALIRAELIDEDLTWAGPRQPEPAAMIISPHGLRPGQFRRIAVVTRRAGRDGEETRRLIVGETLLPAGSGCDDVLGQDDDSTNGDNPDHELDHEEVRHFRFPPGQGAAIQVVCAPSHDYDHTYQVQHGDTIAVPRGLRPNAPACDCGLHMLWARAGAAPASI